MLSLISLVLFGLVVGVISRLLLPDTLAGGFALTIAIGVLGAIGGAYLGRLAGMYGPDDPASFFMAVAGAIACLLAYRAITSRTTSTV